MTDSNPSRNQPHLPHREADSGSGGAAGNGHKPPRSSGSDPYLQYLSVFKTWMETKEQLVELETREAQLRRLDATAERAEAQAEEADHVAAAAPDREQMALRERTVELLLKALKHGLGALVIGAIIGLEIAMFIFHPWLFSLSVLLSCLGALGWFARKERQGRIPTEPEGDP